MDFYQIQLRLHEVEKALESLKKEHDCFKTKVASDYGWLEMKFKQHEELLGHKLKNNEKG